MSLDSLLSKLQKVSGKGPRYRAICPAHESKNGSLSLSIWEPDPERILLHCHAGCSVQDIAGSIGLDLADLFPPRVTDDQRKPREKKPWRASEVLDSLRFELHVAFVILSDVAAGIPITKLDRTRAGTARDRIVALIGELTNAH